MSQKDKSEFEIVFQYLKMSKNSDTDDANQTIESCRQIEKELDEIEQIREFTQELTESKNVYFTST